MNIFQKYYSINSEYDNNTIFCLNLGSLGLNHLKNMLLWFNIFRFNKVLIISFYRCNYSTMYHYYDVYCTVFNIKNLINNYKKIIDHISFSTITCIAT